MNSQVITEIKNLRSEALETVNFYQGSPILNRSRQDSEDMIPNSQLTLSFELQTIIEDNTQIVRCCNQILDDERKNQILGEILSKINNSNENK